MAWEVVAAALAVVAALVIYRYYPDTGRRWWARIMAARRVAFAILGVIVALVFIGTGNPLLVLVGALLLGFGVLTILYRDVPGQVRSFIGI